MMYGLVQVYELPRLPEGFKIMVAGNMGKVQNLEAVSEVIMDLKEVAEVKWIFVRGGSCKEWMEQFIKV